MKSEDKIFVCPICYKVIISGRRPSNCNHLFSKKCLSIWNKQSHSCPLCRKYFNKIIIEDSILPWLYSNK